MNDDLYNNFVCLWGNESDVFRRLKDSCVIWINEKDESKLIRKEKNLPRQKEKKFGEISVRDTEVLVDGDPRRLSWKGFCWLSLLCELKYESFVVRGRRNFMGFVGFFIFYCKYKFSVFLLITFLKILSWK